MTAVVFRHLAVPSYSAYEVAQLAQPSSEVYCKVTAELAVTHLYRILTMELSGSLFKALELHRA